MGKCLFPIRLKKNDVVVPCGKCVECRKRYVSNWSFRLLQQEKASEDALFLTLTYNNETVPRTKRNYRTLDKRDIQCFFKRLRKSADRRSPGKPIKYFTVGEYGSTSKRPHYHSILYNVEPEILTDGRGVKLCKWYGYDGRTEINSQLWKKGHITIGLVTGASIGYCLKYLCKPKKVPLHSNDDRLKEFALMSKGLGLAYLENSKNLDWHFKDFENRMYVNVGDGKIGALPRYYRDKMYYEGEKRKLSDIGQLKADNDQLEVIEKQTIVDANNYYQYKKRQSVYLANFIKKNEIL